MAHYFLCSVIFSMVFLVLSCQPESTSKKAVAQQEVHDSLFLIQQKRFDYQQLSPKWIAYLTEFKSLKSYDRLDVYDKIKRILPSCPMRVLSDNTAEINDEDAVQQMSVTDLFDLIGKSDVVREDGSLVYNLTANADYRVVFFCHANGIVYMSSLEADS